LLDSMAAAAPAALAAQLAAFERALEGGQTQAANRAFAVASHIDPNDPRVNAAQARLRRLTGVGQLVADADRAQNAGEYARAAQDYNQALALDPQNAPARAGLARANAAFGADSYARAAGEGFAALGAGRLDEARAAFERARALRPSGVEALEGLRRVDAATGSVSFAALRAHAEDLESQERWDEALAVYAAALRRDRSLAFARDGEEHAQARMELGDSLQALIDRPEQLQSPQAQDEAFALLQTAQLESSPGPVLRRQIARLQALLPGSDKPVHLSLVSDNLTQVAIASIGSFGSFARHEVDLKPGRYTLIGTRDGYRDVHREITVSAQQPNQTINVSCDDPI
jgi:eukaryotic-like serine/threonine-protein kinase